MDIYTSISRETAAVQVKARSNVITYDPVIKFYTDIAHVNASTPGRQGINVGIDAKYAATPP